MHNGTLTSVVRLEDGHKFDTDSEAIFHTINEKGIDHTWANLQGAAALVWYDTKTHKLNFIRNEQRPLAFAISKDHQTIFWASEVWMVKELTKRRYVMIGDVFIPNPNMLFTIRVSRAGNIVEESRELEPYKWVIPAQYIPFRGRQTYIPYPRRTQFNTDATFEVAKLNWHEQFTKEKNQRMELEEAAKNQNVLSFIPQVALRQQTADEEVDILTKAFYHTYKTCAFCRETLDGQYGTATIIDAHQAACEECSNMGHLEGINLKTGAY